MNNKVGFNRLGVRTGHRRALKRNMVISLLKHEQITTTKAKAKEIRRLAEKLITRAKQDTVHNRRQIARFVHDKTILGKLFVDLGRRYEARAGGYTRMVKLGFRQGDAAELVILELVDRNATPGIATKDTKVIEKTIDGDAKEKKTVATKTTKPKTASTKAAGATKTKTTAGIAKVQRGGSARGK
ncbi:MAG: 50S ribosomal protein L17 [Spirochaetia bacterium]